MAAPTGGGGKFTIIKKKFDPTKTTLKEVVEMYIQESGKGFNAEGHRSKFTSQGSPYKDFLDKPVMEFLESSFDDETNPLLKFYDTNKSVGSRRSYHSLAKGIEANVESQIARSTSKELAHYKADGIPKLTNTVILDPKPGQRALRYAFNHQKAGDFQLALLEHAKKNPKDIPVVRATLAALHLGFRPNEIQKMPATALFPPLDNSVAPGIFISGDLTKMDSAIDIPASSHVHGILTSSLESNKKRFGSTSNVPNLMFLTDEGTALPNGAITNLLKKIKVPGVIQDKQTGKFLDYFTSAYDMRRYNSTIAYKARFPLETMARMKGRAITSIAGAGSEGVYPSPITGLYDDIDLEPHEKLSTIIHDQLNNKLKIKGDSTLSSNQDLVENYKDSTKGNNLLQITSKAEGQSYDVTEKLSDTDFKAPKLPEGQTIEGTAVEVDDSKPITSISSEHFDDDELKALEDIGISEDKPTTTKDKIIKAGKALKGPAKLAVAPTLFGLMLPDEVRAAEERFEGTDTGFVRGGIKDLGLQDTAAQVEGAVVAGAKAFDPGVELAYDVAEGAGEFVKEAREKGIPEALGLDTEKQKQMNVLRKQRLADRVERNRSDIPPEDQGFINQNEIGR